MTNTPTKPPTDRTMWRQLITRTHPDAEEVEHIGWYHVCESMAFSDSPDESKRRAG